MYKKLKTSASRFIVILSCLLLIICIGALFWLSGGENALHSVLKEIAEGVIFAALTVLFLNVANWIIGKKNLEEQHDADIARRIWDLLRARRTEDNIIRELYDKEAASDVMYNSISYFTAKLAHSFCKMAERGYKVIRENFSYKIKILHNRHTGIYSLGQHIRYTRHILPATDDKEICIKCAFTFSTNTLEELLADNSYFFREELEDEQLIATVREAALRNDAATIIEALNLDMSLFRGNTECPIPAESIKLDLIKDKKENLRGVALIHTICALRNSQPADPDTPLMPSENGMISYTARVRCHFPIPRISRFFCAFVDPVIGNTKVNIAFSNDIVNNVKDDVKRITFLTMPDGDDKRITFPDKYEMLFETSETIFPSSGILTFWEAPSEE